MEGFVIALVGTLTPMVIVGAFYLGKAFHRLGTHTEEINGIKRKCEEFTQHCSDKQDARYDQVKDSLSDIKTSVGTIGTKVQFLFEKNGGSGNA
jgi:hypothetical protein